MSITTWTREIETGFENIDAQHRALFSLMDEIESELAGAPSERGVGSRFRQLLEFTDLHFATEERLMRRHGYVEQASHHAAHHDLRERITDATARELDGGDQGQELLTILSSWLVEHIRAHDLPMAGWMRTLSRHDDPPSSLPPETAP